MAKAGQRSSRGVRQPPRGGDQLIQVGALIALEQFDQGRLCCLGYLCIGTKASGICDIWAKSALRAGLADDFPGSYIARHFRSPVRREPFCAVRMTRLANSLGTVTPKVPTRNLRSCLPRRNAEIAASLRRAP